MISVHCVAEWTCSSIFSASVLYIFVIWTIHDATFIELSLLKTIELYHYDVLVLFNFHISVPYSLEFKHTLLQFCGSFFIQEGYRFRK